MEKIATLLYDLLKHAKPAMDPTTGKASKAKVDVDEKVLNRVKEEIEEIVESYPLYPELELI